MFDMDWGPVYKKLAEAWHWTPRQIREELTLHDFERLLMDQSKQGGSWSPEEQLAKRNEIRAKKGLPPIQPRERKWNKRN